MDVFTLYAIIIGTIALIIGIYSLFISIHNLNLAKKSLEEERTKFQVKFEPELKGEVPCIESTELKCRVTFFCKKGNVVIYRIWQHKGGEIGVVRMKILDGISKKEIDGGWTNKYSIIVEENIPKDVFLVFYQKESLVFKPQKVSSLGVQIDTSEGTIIREFDIKWIK